MRYLIMTDVNGTKGAIKYSDESRPNDFLFRVSLKAVITNNKGQILVVKENGRDWWDIPGGGLDYGESIKEALARELFEEVAFKGEFSYEAILIEDPRHLVKRNVYQTRVTFAVTPDNFKFSAGADADDVMFVNPDDFKNSELITDRKIYEYSQLAIKRLAAL